MDENTFRPDILRILKPLNGVYVENVMRAGCCDINYIEGWLELKWLAEWPKRPETIVKFPKFRPAQRVFLLNRSRLGGRAHLLLRVGKEWLLLPGYWSAVHLGVDATREQIRAAAEQQWPKKLIAAELIAALRRPLSSPSSLRESATA